MALSEEEKEFIQECKKHVRFCKNIDSHAWTNILITGLIEIIERGESNDTIRPNNRKGT